MVALSVQAILLAIAAYLLGATVGCFLRRNLATSAAPAAVTGERRVDPLPDADAGLVGSRRFVKAGGETLPASATVPAALQAPPARAADDAAHDLRRIRAIDAHTEAALNALGVRRYEHIAAWMRPDIQRIAQALALPKARISRENWIEQAQILSKGGETRYAARAVRGEIASAAPSPDAGRPPAVASRRVAPAQATPAKPSVAAPAAATRTVAAPPAVAARPPTAPSASPQPPARPAPAAPPSAPRVAERAAFARPAAAPAAPLAANPGAAKAQGAAMAAAVARRPAPPAAADNLQRISGIDMETERRLTAAGVTRYQQIAAWSAADVARVERLLDTRGRIGRENWIEQAQILSKGGDTAFSRAFDRKAQGEAPPPTSARTGPDEASGPTAAASVSPAKPVDLSALRSVRSQAYHDPEPGPEAAHRVGSHNRVVRTEQPQDLKRIRGIGVLIEKRLAAMGITTYEQIANWTAQDIERVSRSLDFKGRIERENWVEQARILASGGATEFSRRVDRGEADVARGKS